MNYNKKHKILLISTEFPPGPGGIGNHAWNLSRHLNNKVYVDVLTVSDYADEHQCKYFDKKEKVKIYRFKRYPLSAITYFHRLLKIIKYIKYNNYSHCLLSGFFALSIGPVIKLINNKMIIVGILHGSELIQNNPLLRYFLSVSLKCLRIVISVSKYTNSFIPIRLGENQSNYIIPNGVNKGLFNDIAKNNKIISGNPRLLTVGSLTDRKGQINLIKSLPKIQKKYPEVHYHCVGLPINKDDIIKQVNNLKMEKYVTIHGVIPNTELNNIYKQTDILIMLSQNKIKSCIEGFGIAILEANLFGVPAVGSKNTGMEDAIIQNKTGVLVDPYSNEEILDGLDILLKQRKHFSQNAVAWALEHNWEKISDRYLKAIISG